MIPQYATPEEMELWARSLMAGRHPDVIIGDDYLRRWWVVPRNEGANVYLHDIRRSDDDRALHDHPWNWTTRVLSGRYFEHTPDGVFERKAGDIVSRKATDLHRIEIRPGENAITLFVTGPKVREWGFACPQGWRHWKEFTSPNDSSKTGKGCE